MGIYNRNIPNPTQRFHINIYFWTKLLLLHTNINTTSIFLKFCVFCCHTNFAVNVSNFTSFGGLYELGQQITAWISSMLCVCVSIYIYIYKATITRSHALNPATHYTFHFFPSLIPPLLLPTSSTFLSPPLMPFF